MLLVGSLAFFAVMLAVLWTSKSPKVRCGGIASIDTVRIVSVERMSVTEGSADIIRTENFYMVHTDRRVYRIDLEGVFARPAIVRALRPGRTYAVAAIGFNMPVFGEYGRIIKAAECQPPQ